MAVITRFDPWRSPLCTCPPKYSFSAYTGCAHACKYCYISAYIPRAFQSRAKADIIRRLRSDMRRIDPKLHISIANSSDPYTPPEEKLGITRQALQILLGGGLKVQLITKSDSVLRDLDLLRRGNCSVSFSMATLDRKVARRLEPRAPPPERRLRALRRLVKEGVPCSVRIDPIIPGLNDADPKGLVRAVAESGAEHVVASTYKAKGGQLQARGRRVPRIRGRLGRIVLGFGSARGKDPLPAQKIENRDPPELEGVGGRFWNDLCYLPRGIARAA